MNEYRKNAVRGSVPCAPLVRVGVCVAFMAFLSCAPPHRDYSLSQIAETSRFDELMHVQATIADPWFGIVDEFADRKLSDAEWAKLQDMAVRLQATAGRVSEFSKGAGFDRLNNALKADALKLEQSAKERAQPEAATHIRAILVSCKSCHDTYR